MYRVALRDKDNYLLHERFISDVLDLWDVMEITSLVGEGRFIEIKEVGELTKPDPNIGGFV